MLENNHLEAKYRNKTVAKSRIVFQYKHMKTTRTMPLEHSLTLDIPFKTKKQAFIASQVLMPDPILKPQDFQVEYTTKDNILSIQFHSIDDRVLRVGVSSIIDSVKTIIETIDELE